MDVPTIEDNGGDTDTLNPNDENSPVLETFSSGKVLISIIILVVLYLLSKWLVSQQEPNIRVDDYRESSQHHWQYSDLILHPLHCNVCHNLLLVAKGQFCSNCGIGSCLESSCLRKANLTHKCKEVATVLNGNNDVENTPNNKDSDESVKDIKSAETKANQIRRRSTSHSQERGQGRRKFLHHWIAGNLPLNSECEVCEEACGDGPGIVDLRCCWCQRAVHNSCQKQFSDICDLGEFRRFIIPPYSVLTTGKVVESRKKMADAVMRKRGMKQRTFSEVVEPSTKDNRKSEEFTNVPEGAELESYSVVRQWQPLIVIANRKSGNNDGAAILASFRSHLNPAQVVDLDEMSMEDGLKLCQMIYENNGIRSICLVAGGDGTIGWVLNTMDKLGFSGDNMPTLYLVPLGTGNDLARTLGFGPGADGSLNVRDVMRQIANEETTTETLLDRWKVDVKPKRYYGIKLPSQTIFMQNYLSIGVDALVTYNFHKARESPFYFMSSRLINKLIYFSYGTKDVLERECKDLDKILELYLDDQKVTLPDGIEAIVVLNIPSWGAGVRPWELGSGGKNDSFEPPSVCDGLLEIFCIYSSFHIAQMQVGLSEPHRLGQASKVRIVLHGSAPMQNDGEPWEQHPAEINIDHHKQIPIFQIDESNVNTK